MSACLVVGELDSVAALNTLAREHPGVPAFQGGDVALDQRLRDGRRLWLFGDSLRSLAGSIGLVRNAMLVQDGDCLHVVLPREGDAVVPDRADGVGYWPMSVFRVVRPSGMPGWDMIRVFLLRVRSEGPGLFDFTILGPAMAEFSVDPGAAPRLLRVVDLGPDDSRETTPLWGAAVLRTSTWIYIYGTSTRSIPGIHGFALRVARVRPGDVSDMSRWRYWSGRSWVHDAALASILIEERGGVSQILSVFRKHNRWYALSKRDEVLGRSLTVWSAPAPQGPFRDPESVADLPCEGDLLRYMPLAHPTLFPRAGTIVVSYSQNTDFEDICAEPTLYRPRFLRLRLP